MNAKRNMPMRKASFCTFKFQQQQKPRHYKSTKTFFKILNIKTCFSNFYKKHKKRFTSIYDFRSSSRLSMNVKHLTNPIDFGRHNA